ncbi:MAG TPA: hypothetical protein VJ184_02140 [Chryseolinea sp.]|nr:hypothetical protein [Chryseolinea sp.]
MDEKISLESISLYGDAYSEKVLKGFFGSKDKITGSEILSLCNVHQVNLFVVRELFKAWKEETKNLKSPYFNYENPDVKDALENLMDKLSNNIEIDQTHFAPLLKKAVGLTLMVVFNPYDFFSLIISGKNNKLEVEPFREEIKYLKINKAPLDRLLQKLEEKGVQEISGNEAFAILDLILEEVNFNPEDVEDYLEKFSLVVPLDVSKFYTDKNQPVEPLKDALEVKVEEIINKQIPKPLSPLNINTQQKKPSSSVHETLTSQSRPSFVDNFKKIAKIKDSLTINQKFMFTKVLFHGDFELFSKAIDHLDRQDTMKAAIRYIEEEHASTWDRDSEEFHEFMELVDKRFA